MPTYEYECEKCGFRFEELEPMTAPKARACPECEGKSKRLISAGSGIIMKDSAGQGAARPRLQCGRDKTCCGLDEPCGEPPCGH